MSWPSTWPPSGTTTIQDYMGFLVHAWRALSERAWAIGYESFPGTARIWGRGVVASLTADTLTATVAEWEAGQYFGAFGDDEYRPTLFDVIIGNDNDYPWQIVRAPILGNAAGALTLGDFADYLTSGFVASHSALIGKHFYIVRRGGVWWHDRWLARPNDPEAWRGLAADSTVTTLVDETAAWTVNQWAGFELMIQAGGLQRITILSNTADTLTFAAQTFAPAVGDRYAIVAAGNRWRYVPTGPSYLPPSAQLASGGAVQKWYGGYTRDYYTRHPDGVLRGAPVPEATVILQRPDGVGGSESYAQPIFDVDFYIDYDDPLNTNRDEYLCVGLYQTLRGLQLAVENMCPYFVPPVSHDGAEAVALFTPATLFHYLGINAYSSTTGSVIEDGAGINFATVTLPYTPIEIHYAILDDRGNVLTSGVGVATSNTTLERTLLYDDFTEEHESQTIRLSLGWTRKLPREFRYKFDKTCWLPADDLNPTPQEGAPGSWTTRPASTTYLTQGAMGIVADSEEAFVEGEAARYVGDNWSDPTIQPLDLVGDGMAAITPFFDNFFTGTLEPTAQALVDRSRSGLASDGSSRRLTDASKTWWPGVLITHTGTASGGSTTSLIDTAQDGSTYWDGTNGRWVGHVIEINDATDGSGAWHKRPITTYTAGAQTIGWSEALPFSASGKSYRIREPAHELNRWRGRSVIIRQGASTATAIITHSDDTTLYFADVGFVIGPGASYSIDDPGFGTVWMRTSTDWIKPESADPRGQPWHANQTENLPTTVTRYGRVMKGDYIQHPTPWTELYHAINALVWTLGGVRWSPQGDESEEAETEYNFKAATGCASTGYDVAPPATETNPDPESAVDSAFEAYDEAYLFASAGRPYAKAVAYKSDPDIGDPEYQVALSRRYAWPYVESIPTRLACTADIFVFAAIEDVLAPGPMGTDAQSGVPYFTFDNNGDLASYRAWKKVQSLGPATTPARRGDQFGSLAHPNVGPAPGFDDENFLPSVIGYAVTGELSILRWNVSGGMSYV